MSPARAVARQDAWFYNLATLQTRREHGQREPEAQVAAELGAILHTRPAFLGLVETVGHDLPHVPGYHDPIRDRSSESRANISAYVRKDLPLSREEWHDLEETWSRTQHDGEHPARSFLSFWVGRTKVVVAHQAPRGTDNTIGAQTEGIAVLSRLLATNPDRRPAVVVMDANRRASETGPGPALLANRVGGRVIGNRIDCGVLTGDARVDGISYPSRVGGVRLRSDHPHALRFTLTLDARWLQAPRPAKEAR